MADNKITFFGKCNGIAVEQLIRYGKFNMNVKHFHNQYELFYIIEGERQFFFDNKSYNAHAGDLAIIDTNLVHTTCSITSEDKGYNRVIMYIDYEKMCDFDKRYPGLNIVDFIHKNYGIYNLDEDLRIAFLNLYRDIRHELTKKTNGYQSRIEIVTLYWLYKLLSLKKEQHQKHPEINSAKKNSASNISTYLEKNYTKAVSLDTIAEDLFMSKYYICRIFKEYTGFTITEYINILRIKKATQLLENSNQSISDVATELGFESASYFERTFKKIMNVTPLKYRKTHQSVTIEHEELNTLDDSDYID